MEEGRGQWGEEGGRLLLWRPFHCVWAAFFLPFFFFFFPVALRFLWHFKSISLMSRTAIVPIVNIHRDISLPHHSPRAWGLDCVGSFGDSHHVLLPEHPAVASSRLGSGSCDYKQKILGAVCRVSLKRTQFCCNSQSQQLLPLMGSKSLLQMMKTKSHFLDSWLAIEAPVADSCFFTVNKLNFLWQRLKQRAAENPPNFTELRLCFFFFFFLSRTPCWNIAHDTHSISTRSNFIICALAAFFFF